VSPDDIMRAVMGMGVLLIGPGANNMWKELFGVKDYRFTQAIGAGAKAGVGVFGTIAQRVPSFGLGKGIAQFTQSAGQL
jgi:hypothetical protein